MKTIKENLVVLQLEVFPHFVQCQEKKVWPSGVRTRLTYRIGPDIQVQVRHSRLRKNFLDDRLVLFHDLLVKRKYRDEA